MNVILSEEIESLEEALITDKYRVTLHYNKEHSADIRKLTEHKSLINLRQYKNEEISRVVEVLEPGTNYIIGEHLFIDKLEVLFNQKKISYKRF
jgi:hypothetical protein